MSVLDNSAITHIPALSGLKIAKNSISRYLKYSREKERVELEFFFYLRKCSAISNSSNTKYFYDWSISNSSNTPISNYFLTVQTKEEFTVACHIYLSFNGHPFSCIVIICY